MRFGLRERDKLLTLRANSMKREFCIKTRNNTSAAASQRYRNKKAARAPPDRFFAACSHCECAFLFLEFFFNVMLRAKYNFGSEFIYAHSLLVDLVQNDNSQFEGTSILGNRLYFIVMYDKVMIKSVIITHKAFLNLQFYYKIRQIFYRLVNNYSFSENNCSKQLFLTDFNPI